MKNFKIKARILISSMTLLLVIFVQPAIVLAGNGACGTTPNSSKDQILGGIGENNATGNTDCSGQGVTDVAKTIVNILSLVVGIITVIMIIVSGLRFVASGGDSGKVASAKSSLVYALIGLVLVALSQTIVHFVLNASINNTVNVH
jgi:hypothetical protein